MRVNRVVDRKPKLDDLRNGDLRAFQQVYDHHCPRLHRFLLRLSGNPAVAQDLLQDTWLAFARNAHRLDHETDLAAWLFTVARNRHRSWRRWAVFDLLRLDRLRAVENELAPAADEEYALSETQAHVEAAIQRLSPALREVLLLVVVEGLETGQVAAVLGIQPDAVRQRLSRARSQLAKHLEAGTDARVADLRVDQGGKP